MQHAALNSGSVQSGSPESAQAAVFGPAATSQLEVPTATAEERSRESTREVRIDLDRYKR